MVEGGCVHRRHGQVQTVDSVARLEVGHGRLGGAPRAEGRERQAAAARDPKHAVSQNK